MKKTYTNEKVEVEGNFITFSGKLNPTTNTLIVDKIEGDVTLHDEAIQNFCITNKIGKAVIK